MQQRLNRKARRAAKAQQGWVPLQRATPVPISEAKVLDQIAMAKKIRPDLVTDIGGEAGLRKMILDEIDSFTVWRNDEYVVSRRELMDGPQGQLAVVHLSIRRVDRGAIRDWRHMQRIKNELVGPECEGIELYPAESRLMDSANQFHMWVVADPKWRFPFGYFSGRIVSGESGAGAVQRPLEIEEPFSEANVSESLIANLQAETEIAGSVP